MLKNKPLAGLVIRLIVAFFLTLWLLHPAAPEPEPQIINAVYHPEPPPVPSHAEQVTDLLTTWVRRNAIKPVSDKQARLIVQETFRQSKRNGVDPMLMLAVIDVESQFDHKARSSAGALGLTQVIPEWHMDKLKRPQQQLETKQSIRVGTEVLAEYMAWHKGDTDKALLRYNGSLGKPIGYNRKVLRTKANIERYVERRLV